MRSGSVPHIALFLCVFSFFSCAGTPPAPVPETPPGVSEAPAAEKPSHPESAAPPASPASPEPDVTAPGAGDPSPSISREEYSRTFGEVETVIAELNRIILAGDYQGWLQHLTPAFVDQVMAPRDIEAINQQPVLKRNRIVIRTLADYFMYVVVPSRANVHLDELDFADSHRVKAIMYVGDRPVLLYQLEKIREKWKISTW